MNGMTGISHYSGCEPDRGASEFPGSHARHGIFSGWNLRCRVSCYIAQTVKPLHDTSFGVSATMVRNETVNGYFRCGGVQ